MKVIHRSDGNYGDTVHAVVSSLLNIYLMNDKEYSQAGKAARATSKMASWDNFIKYYDTAYEQALCCADGRNEQE